MPPPPILHQIKLLIEKFDKIYFHHIKRHLNEEVDFIENCGVLLNPDELKVYDEKKLLKPLP